MLRYFRSQPLGEFVKTIDKENPGVGSPVEPSWFDRPKNINRLIGVLVVICVMLVLADLAYENPHPHFEPYETMFGFQAWFGFIAFVTVVFLGRCLRPLVRREESYYEGDQS